MIDANTIKLDEIYYIKITKNGSGIKLYTLKDENDMTILESFNVSSFILKMLNSPLAKKMTNKRIEKIKSY